MIKKIKITIILLCSIVFIGFSKFVNAAELDGEYLFTDTSDPLEDLRKLGIDPTLYFLTEENQEFTDKWYVIGISESFDYTNTVSNYVYLYNPYTAWYSNIDLSLEFKYRGGTYTLYSPDSSFGNYNESPLIAPESCSVGYLNGIYKFKIKMGITGRESERYYSFGNIRHKNKNGEVITNNCSFFNATFNDRKNGDIVESSFSINSMVFIENDEIFSIMLFDDNLSWWEGFKSHYGFDAIPQLFFYNFSTNVDIDEIVYAKVIYDAVYYRYMTDMGDHGRWEKVPTHTNYPDMYYGFLSEYGATREIKQGTYSYDWGGVGTYEFDYFHTPASERFTDGEFNSFKNQGLDQEKFSSYDHSILFHIGGVKGAVLDSLQFYTTIENMQLVELHYLKDGVLYRAYIVDGDGNDENIEVPTLPPSQSFGDWIKDELEKLGDMMGQLGSIIKYVIYVILGLVGILIIVFIGKFIWWLVNAIVNLIRGKS